MKTTASKRTQNFMDALGTLERTQGADALVGLFADEATLERLNHRTYQGRADTETFWESYLSPFAEITTEFFNVTEDGDGAVLEWVSKGHLQGGKAIEYRGSSSLSFAGDKIASFRTYYDSAAFLNEGAHG